MKLPTENSKYLSSWKYVEVAKYVPKFDKVVRIKNGDMPLLMDVNNIEKFRTDNNNIGLYTSVWNYNIDEDLDDAVRLGPLYFDIDNENIEVSYYECTKLYFYLSKFIPDSAILIYFTGKKGFHVECEPIALGINPSNNLPNIFRFIASTIKQDLNLTSLDFSVYDARRMWRLEGSRHQSTGLYKNLIPKDMLINDSSSIQEYCDIRRSNIVEDQVFNSTANQWFREFTYNLEIEKEKSKDFLAYFNKHGSSVFKDVEDKDKEFTEERLIESCPAIKSLWKQAVEKKWLDHEARLFLCSILTYTDESIELLHKILSNCEDYNVEKSNSHINDWIRRRQLGIGGRPYTCERANVAGVGCGQCHLDKKKKWIKIGNKYVESEEESSPSPIRFAYKSINKEVKNG